MADKILTVGERIKQVRIDNDMTLRQFGGFLDVTAEYIKDVESDKVTPTHKFIHELCYEFGMSEEYFNPDFTLRELKAHKDTEPQKADASSLINQILESEEFNYQELDEQLYNNNGEWRTTKLYIDNQFENLKTFVVRLSGNKEEKNSIGRLEDNVSNLQHMWGNACFLEGFKKGLLLMQWAKGQADASGTIL